MPEKHTQTRLCREVLSATMELQARRLWHELTNDECFAVTVPGEEHPMYATIMGQGGEEFGLMLFRGQDAARHLANTLQDQWGECDIAEETASMGFGMSRLAEVPPPFRSFLKKAKAPATRGSVVPLVVVQEPGKRPRGPSPNEVRVFLFALKGILKADEDGLLKTESILTGETVTAIHVEGDPLAPRVTYESIPNEATRATNVFQLPVVPDDLRGLPRFSSRWLLGFPEVPIEIQEDDRLVRMLLIVEEQSGMALVAVPAQGGTDEAVGLVHDALRGKNARNAAGLPSEVHVAHRGLFKALSPMFDALEVVCHYAPRIPALEKVLSALLRYAVEGESPDSGPESPQAT